MSDGYHPDGFSEPTSVMPVTPGPAGTVPADPPTGTPPGTPPGPPPGAPPLPDDEGSGQPPWVIPTVVGIVALAVVLLALILTRGGDDDEALPAVDTTTTTIAPDTTLDVVTETSIADTTTSVETTTTVAPDTTLETTTTVAATTSAPTTVAPTTVAPAPTGPTAQPASAIGANTASLATVDNEQTFAVLGTCASTPTVGLQAISSVLANESGTVYVVDVYLDEGGEPFVEVADMSQSIAGFIFGQDTPGDNFRWSADIADPNSIDQVTLSPLDGTSDPISLSMKSDAPTECGRGFVVSPSPFPEAGPVDFVDQFETDVPGDGFAVLAACGDGATYVTSGGGLLSAVDGDTLSLQYAVDLPNTSTFWSTPDDVTTEQQITFQNGAGGDIDYATQVVNGADDQIGYVNVRIQPTVAGGLDLIDCPA